MYRFYIFPLLKSNSLILKREKEEVNLPFMALEYL